VTKQKNRKKYFSPGPTYCIADSLQLVILQHQQFSSSLLPKLDL